MNGEATRQIYTANGAVENGHDPRPNVATDDADPNPDRFPHHPLHHIHPWAHHPPSLDDRNIEHEYTHFNKKDLAVTVITDKPREQPFTGVSYLAFLFDGVLKTIFSLMQALFQGLDNTAGPNGTEAGPRNGPGGFPGLHQLFASVLNPANAAHGDVVYSQEALDRIISQFMEQHNGSSAPGPASAAAISALPTKKVDKEMLGTDGKAECSVCMDNVELGDDVTLLPCQHWFHGEQGIMPKEPSSNGEATIPRAPGQEPRNSLPPLSPGADSGPGGFHFRYQNGNGNRNGGGPTTMFRSQQDILVPRSRTERRRSSASTKGTTKGTTKEEM
ncbi:MAG: hypothetical protein Q9204_000240 [Flavoplaca sp. TL-2023a]